MSSDRERYRVTQTLQTLHISICDLSATTFNVTIVELITIIAIRNAWHFCFGPIGPAERRYQSTILRYQDYLMLFL